MSELTRISNRFEFNEDPRGADFIGQGGMGNVYVGRDTQTQDRVAVKVLKPEVIQKAPDIVERFVREGEALRQLNHPNIVKMLGSDNYDDYHYLVMEYVGGGSLRDLLDRDPRLSMQHALYIALDLADALTRAHRLNILHRDIKPGNVLIADDGTPRLTDFGMARLGNSVNVTQSGAIVGTLAYLSPEALQGETLDARTDIWAFGVMLYEILAGERPFGQSQPGQLVNAILMQPTPDLETIRPDLPTGLVDLIYRMLEKDLHARIPSVRLIGAEIESLIHGTSTTTMPAVVPPSSNPRFEVTTPTPEAASSISQITRKNNLPAQPTPFVGREQEVDEVGAMVRDPNQRLITLLGPGGIGKSRLSLAVAEKHLSDFRDGVYFVPLASLENVDNIASAIAENVRFSFGGSEDPKEQLLSFLHEKNMLLIMDNFEHLTDGAGIVSEILQYAPDITILVSSREKLRLRGEQLYEVQGMQLPNDDDPLDVIAKFPVIQLFLQSAHRIVPDFELTEEDSKDTVHICQMVQGLPLGVELAASWLEMMDVHEISSEIADSLDFLETELRDVPERHRSIRAVFDYSWNLMSDDEREIFMKLSVFRGGFERTAAEKIADAKLRSLNHLVNKSLLSRDPGGRYQLNKLLRQYAEEKFADHPDYRATREKHAMYYGNFMEKAQEGFNSVNELTVIRKIDAEIENLRSAWVWAIEHKYWDALEKVMHSMMLFFLAESMLQEGRGLFEQLVNALIADGQTNSDLFWRARIRQAWVVSRLGQYDVTWEYGSQAEAYFREIDPTGSERANALNLMSYAAMMQGRFDESADFAREASELCRDDMTTYYMAMGNLGYAEYLRGNLEEAKRIYEQINESGITDNYSATGRAYGLNNLGEIVRTMGDFRHAKSLFEEAYEIFKTYKNQRGMAFTLNNIAGICYFMGDLEEAKRMYAEGYRHNRKIGDRSGIGHSLSALGNIAINENNLDDADRYFSEALALRRELGDLRSVSDSLIDLGNVALNQRDYVRAIQYYEEAYAIYQELGIQEGSGLPLSGIGLAKTLSGELDAARNYLEESLALSEEMGNPIVTARSVVGLGILALMEQQYESAQEYILRGIRLAHDLQARIMMLISVAAQGMVEAEIGDKERAVELLTLVSRYPLGFGEILRPQIDDYLDKLTKQLSDDEISSATESSKLLVLENLVRELIEV